MNPRHQSRCNNKRSCDCIEIKHDCFSDNSLFLVFIFNLVSKFVQNMVGSYDQIMVFHLLSLCACNNKYILPMLIRGGRKDIIGMAVFQLLPMLIRGGRKDIIGMAVFWLLPMLIRRGEERYYRNGYVFQLLPMLIRRGEERYYRNGYMFQLLPILIRGGRKDIIGMVMCSSSFCPC